MNCQPTKAQKQQAAVLRTRKIKIGGTFATDVIVVNRFVHSHLSFSAKSRVFGSVALPSLLLAMAATTGR